MAASTKSFVLLLASLLLFVLPRSAAAQSYRSWYRIFHVTGYPTVLVPGDFNGDGRPDLVSGSEQGDASFLAGRAGGFEAARPIQLGDAPFEIAAADFNRDGLLDLAALGLEDNVVTTALGNGDGTFHAADSFPLGSRNNGYLMATGDFDGDGLPDIVSATVDSLVLVLFPGRGDGSVGDPDTTALSFRVEALSVFDGDNNGLSDVLLTGRTDTASVIVVVPGSAAGLREVHPMKLDSGWSRGDFRDAQMADLNSDGRLDLVFWEPYTNRVGVQLGLPSGDFGETAGYGVDIYLRSLLVADATGDSLPDVLITDYEGDRLLVLPGDGHGGLGAPLSFPAGPAPFGIAVGDYSGDGLPDVAVAQTYSGIVGVLDGVARDYSDRVYDLVVDSYPTSIVTGDYDGDGFRDFIAGTVSNGGSGSIVFFHGRGNGTFGDAVETALGFSVAGLAAADVTGDHITDLVVTSWNSNRIEVLKGYGDGNFSPAWSMQVNGGPVQLSVQDLDDDGDSDLVVVMREEDGFQVFRNRGGGVFDSGPEYPSDNGNGLVMALVNDDRFPDVVISNRTKAHVSIFPGRGDGTFGAPSILDTWSKPQDVLVGDMTGDCLPDLIVGFEDSRRFTVFTNRGNARFDDGQDHVDGHFMSHISLLDLQGDGRPEIIEWHREDGYFSILPANLDPASSEELGAGANLGIMVAADFNQDGYPDFLATRPGNDHPAVIGVFLSDGPLRLPAPNLPLAVAGVWPNPTAAGASIQFRGSASTVECELFDIRGRLVRNLTMKDATSGTCLHWDGLAGDGRRCPAGNYYFRLRSGGQTAAGRIVIVR